MSELSRIELYWPGALPTEAALRATDELQRAGLEARCRVQPTRRGAELSAVVLLCGSALEPFLRVVFERLADDAHTALRNWVQRLLGRDRTEAAPASVVFESEATGAEFVFTAGLSEEAFRAALAVDPGNEPGRWVWDGQHRAWTKFEASRQPSMTKGVS